MSPARRDRAGLLGLGFVALALRLAYHIDHDEDLDSLRFRLAVERFDIAALRPHAPFYPVYIAAAKLVAGLGTSAHLALGIVSAAAGAALVVLTALLAFELLGRRAAWIAGALALASPFLWLSSEKLLSDVPGAAGTTAALWLLARARRVPGPDRAASLRTVALITLGVGLGVRLSYFPFAIVAMIVVARAEGGRGAYLTRARDLAVGVVPWLVPLVILAGSRPLVIAALGQGTATFLVDTFKWSDGQFHVGAFVGDVALQLVLAGVTAVGRTAGNWETGGTVVVSSAAGLVTGALTGLTYALMQRPECSYTGSLVCW